MKVKTLVEMEIKDWEKYFTRRLEAFAKEKEDMLKLAKILDTFEIPKLDVHWNTIIISFETVKEAREFVKKIFNTTEIKKFKKVFLPELYIPSFSEPKWGYHAEFGKADLIICPAPSQRNCVAKRKLNTFYTWTCEKLEGG